MKRILKVLYKYCTLNCLNLSSDKSKIIVFQKGGNNSGPDNFKYGSENIEVVKEYVYSVLKNAKTFTTRSSLATISTISLIKTVKYKISWNRVNLLVDSLVISILSNASPI